MNMKTIVSAVLITFLVGVSYGKDKVPTGVEIKAPAQTVKASIVREMIGQGWTIDSEDQFQLVFSRNMNGSSACTDIQPKDFMRFTLVENQGSTFVSASSESDHAGPSCRDVRVNTNQKAMHRILTDLKTQVESTTPESETPTAVAFTPATATGIQPSPSTLSPPPAAIPSVAVAPPVDRSSLNVTLPSAGGEEESLGVAARRAREKKAAEAALNTQQ
jgi:hypothetical protein